jgi:hypothetical protein
MKNTPERTTGKLALAGRLDSSDEQQCALAAHRGHDCTNSSQTQEYSGSIGFPSKSLPLRLVDKPDFLPETGSRLVELPRVPSAEFREKPAKQR